MNQPNATLAGYPKISYFAFLQIQQVFMKKTKFNINLLLPDVPDEKDLCVARIIDMLEKQRGIDRVHIVNGNGEGQAQLCFHYDPDEIQISQVEALAHEAGAQITQQYGHLLLEVKGVRHPRHARLLESRMKDRPGIVFVSISGTGFMSIEFEKSVATRDSVLEGVAALGLRILSSQSDGLPTPPAKSACTDGHAHDHDHCHAKGQFFGERTELIFSITSGVMLALGFGLSYFGIVPYWASVVLYAFAYLTGGFFTTQEAVSGISRGRFEIDFLMIVAAIGAAFLGKWAEGALLLFLFSLGHSLEHYAFEKAKKSIGALSELYPKTAFLKTPEGLKEVLVESLQIGQHIVVRPNSVIGADGIIVHGNSSVNQTAITGESMPVDKLAYEEEIKPDTNLKSIDAQHRVFAGTINGSHALEVYIEKVAADSTLSRLIKMVNEAQTQKSETQHFTERIERYYVPSVLVLVFVLLFAFLVREESFGASFYRAMAVLIAASPCALAISTPSAVLSGVARAARGGVLIKGGRPLEELGSVRAMAFDKTGTLTEGKPTLTGVYPVGGEDEGRFLEMVVAVEKLSDHPLAAAIVRGGEERLGRKIGAARNLRAIVARGIEAQYEGDTVYIGNRALFHEQGIVLQEDIVQQVEALEGEGNTTMLVSRGGALAGIITLKDTPRKEAREALQSVKKHNIRSMIMLTGDNQQVADSIAREIGLAEAFGGLLPEQKVKAVEALRERYGSVAMVGDGVNDAPAMARSNVGIAMGAAGSPLALETADVALMADNLSNLSFALSLSKKANNIIRQNLIISIGMVIILIPLTIGGLAIAPAVIGHEGSTMIVVLNALRLLGHKK